MSAPRASACHYCPAPIYLNPTLISTAVGTGHTPTVAHAPRCLEAELYRRIALRALCAWKLSLPPPRPDQRDERKKQAELGTRSSTYSGMFHKACQHTPSCRRNTLLPYVRSTTADVSHRAFAHPLI